MNSSTTWDTGDTSTTSAETSEICWRWLNAVPQTPRERKRASERTSATMFTNKANRRERQTQTNKKKQKPEYLTNISVARTDRQCAQTSTWPTLTSLLTAAKPCDSGGQCCQNQGFTQLKPICETNNVDQSGFSPTTTAMLCTDLVNTILNSS